MKFAVEIGDIMLRNGAEIYRVEDTILYILQKNDIEQCDVYVVSNGIFASANEDMEDACSVIRHVPLGGVHLNRLAALNQLARDVCDHKVSMAEAWKRLEEYKHMPEYPLWLQIIMCGISTAGFAYMFGGGMKEILTALLIGFGEQLLLYACDRREISKFVKVILVGGYVAFTCSLLHAAGIEIREQIVIIGTVMPIFPGISFTTGIRDCYNGDYLSGVIHIFDAVITAVCIAVGSCLPLILQNIMNLI